MNGSQDMNHPINNILQLSLNAAKEDLGSSDSSGIRGQHVPGVWYCSSCNEKHSGEYSKLYCSGDCLSEDNEMYCVTCGVEIDDECEWWCICSDECNDILSYYQREDH